CQLATLRRSVRRPGALLRSVANQCLFGLPLLDGLIQQPPIVAEHKAPQPAVKAQTPMLQQLLLSWPVLFCSLFGWGMCLLARGRADHRLHIALESRLPLCNIRWGRRDTPTRNGGAGTRTSVLLSRRARTQLN